MRNKIVRTVIIPLTVGLLTLSAGCATPDESGSDEVTAAIGSAPLELITPTTAPNQSLAQRVIVFVAYYGDAAYTNLVGAATFSECPGDPSYSWGAQTEFYTIESEPCG